MLLYTDPDHIFASTSNGCNHIPNPVLLSIRESLERWPDLDAQAVLEEQMHSIREARVYGALATYGFSATSNQVEHARQVVLRWLAIFGKDVDLT